MLGYTVHTCACALVPGGTAASSAGCQGTEYLQVLSTARRVLGTVRPASIECGRDNLDPVPRARIVNGKHYRRHGTTATVSRASTAQMLKRERERDREGTGTDFCSRRTLVTSPWPLMTRGGRRKGMTCRHRREERGGRINIPEFREEI